MKKQYTLRHCFNADKKSKGPILIIEVLMEPNGPGSGAFVAHRWDGSGKATKMEMMQLREHYKGSDYRLISDYIDAALT